jgi:hypothetical protein
VRWTDGRTCNWTFSWACISLDVWEGSVTHILKASGIKNWWKDSDSIVAALRVCLQTRKNWNRLTHTFKNYRKEKKPLKMMRNQILEKIYTKINKIQRTLFLKTSYFVLILFQDICLTNIQVQYKRLVQHYIYQRGTPAISKVKLD